MGLCSSAGRVAMGPEGNRLDMVARVPGSSWASDPSCQGRNRRSEMVLLAGQTGVRLEQVAWEMVPRVLAAPAALGAVAPTALLARLGCTSVAAARRPKGGNEGSTENCYGSRSSACRYANTPPLPA